MRNAFVLFMTTCILFAGCIEGLTEEVEQKIEESSPGCNDPTAVNYDEDATSDSACMSQEMMGTAIDDFSTMMEADEMPANVGIKITMTGETNTECLNLTGMTNSHRGNDTRIDPPT